MDIIHTRGSDMVSGPFYFFHAVVCCQAFSQKSEQAEKINPLPSSTVGPYLQVQGAKQLRQGNEIDAHRAGG